METHKALFGVNDRVLLPDGEPGIVVAISLSGTVWVKIVRVVKDKELGGRGVEKLVQLDHLELRHDKKVGA